MMAPLIPREILFGNPDRVSPRLSPDGARLAWLAPDEDVLNIWVIEIEAIGETGGKVDLSAARAVTNDRDRGIRHFAWAHDDRHVLYIQDAGGDENWRLFDVDLDTLERRDLTPFEGVQAQIVALDKRFPNEVLVGLNRDNPQLHDVYRLDLPSGGLEKILDNPGFVGWVADTEFVVRAGVGMRADGGASVMVRDGAGDPWRLLLEVPAEDVLTTDLLSFLPDGRSIIGLSSIGSDSARLVRVDTTDGSMTTLAAEDHADIADVRLNPDTREPEIAFVLRDRVEIRALSEAVRADVEALRALHPGDPTLSGGDDADRRWLVGYRNDRGATPYFRYDRDEQKATFLFEHQPALERYELAPMEPFAFRARDGLEIHAYATFPVDGGREARATVLNVHGGPWARDVWGFDPVAQWLANRGYLCLQINFRGSTGYGKSFVNAGDREWGAKMHDDLLDGLDFAVSAGWADAESVGIIGGSYGGYAALVAAAFTPERFKCAVDIVGPSNLITLIETIPPYWVPLIAQFHRRVGDPATERDFLWERSPLSRVANISIPLLIGQGANDPRVKVEESEQIVRALNAAGIPHEYLLFPDEGHGFAKPENRLRFFARAEAFLAEHLGGRFEP